MSGRGGHVGGIVRLGRGRGRSGRRNFNSSNNRNKRQEMKFYPHGTGPDQQAEKFTKVGELLMLKIQGEFLMELILHNKSAREWFRI